MEYSRKSFDRGLLPATYGAIRTLYPEAEIRVKSYGDWKDGEAGLELLRSPQRSLCDFELSVADSSGVFTISLSEAWDLFYVDIKGGSDDNRKRILELIRGTLHLAEASQEELESEGTLYFVNKRILKLQRLITDLPSVLQATTTVNRLRCFVSFRFDEHSKALALELRDFLELAGLEFISGLGFQPRSISEKVLERLKGQIDLFIIIFSTAGDSAWLHQEIGVAKGRGLPIIVLREEGAQFEEGLLSDTEHSPFPKGQISGSFISILQAVQYIRLKSKTI